MAGQSTREKPKGGGQFFWTKLRLQFHSCGPNCCDTQPTGFFDIPPLTKLEMAKPGVKLKAKLTEKWEKGEKWVPMIVHERLRLVERDDLMAEAEYERFREDHTRKLAGLREKREGPVGQEPAGGE